MEISKNRRIHFIGIGGCGMSAIARILLELGYTVSGSDLKENTNTIRLRDLGAKIYPKQEALNLRGVGCIVVSTAIPKDNPEYEAALQENLQIYRRAEMLDFVMNKYPTRIAVSGTHGKSTTTSMIARMLTHIGLNPGYVIGAELTDYGGNAQAGDGNCIVAESDESDGSFLLLHPTIGIITNIESEHMEYYKTDSKLFESFSTFMANIVENNGHIIANADDKNLIKLTKKLPEKNITTYSTQKEADIYATDIKYSEEGSSFKLWISGKSQGEVMIRVIGHHNVSNALAAITLGLYRKLSLDDLKKGIFNFSGTKRRFQFIGEINGIRIFDDYGHHPTEIKTTLEGIKNSFKSRVVCIFQPHRYSRTRDLLENFSDSFAASDMTIITEVYSANEQKIKGISGKKIVEKMTPEKRENTFFISSKSKVAPTILPKLKEGDIVITMGAGDIHTVAKEILAQLKMKDSASHAAALNH